MHNSRRLLQHTKGRSWCTEGEKPAMGRGKEAQRSEQKGRRPETRKVLLESVGAAVALERKDHRCL